MPRTAPRARRTVGRLLAGAGLLAAVAGGCGWPLSPPQPLLDYQALTARLSQRYVVQRYWLDDAVNFVTLVFRRSDEEIVAGYDSRDPGGACTAAPDGPWWPCCVIHDVLYVEGGTEEERLAADSLLRDCLNTCGGPGDTYYAAVRALGWVFWYDVDEELGIDWSAVRETEVAPETLGISPEQAAVTDPCPAAEALLSTVGPALPDVLVTAE